MEVQINGEQRDIEPMTVRELLRSLGIETNRVAVERNREIVPKREFESTLLAEGDRLEIVHFVGGG